MNQGSLKSTIAPSAVAEPEPFLTMKEVSAELGIPYWHIVRAVKAGLIPHHTLFNSKKYLRMNEVLAAVKRHGGET